MIGYIANTDQRWFDFLRGLGVQEEVNFWNPSSHYTFRGPVGSPWLFRLKAPINMIGGFGLVAYAQKLPEWLAWECFGQGNGAPTLQAMQAQIGRLRQGADITREQSLSQIGCIILSRPVFFPSELWIPQPADWARSNLRYAKYDLTVGEGKRVWDACLDRARSLEIAAASPVLSEPPPGQRYGDPMLVKPRLGQGTFRLAVTDAYGRACAVTNEHSLPALEAAHIRPYGEGGAHDVRNGLLLRSDLHRLFDRGYVTVTPEHRLEVSPLLKEHFSNGRSYYPHHGQRVTLPARSELQPDPLLLQWHNERVFRV